MAQSSTIEDVEPLPGEAKSWAKGEPIPKDMPRADAAPRGIPAMDVGGNSLDAMTSGLADIQRQRMAASGKVYDDMSGTLDKDMARVEEARKNTGIKPDELKPWDHEAEQAKRLTDPIQAFGSLGSVLGILASTFTHAPMVNAMDASAAAINAIKEGNTEDYNRAYKAWEANTKLSLDRHKLQHEQYTDAIALMQTNMAAGEAKMRVLAARFGDQKALYLLENGMDKELLELQSSRQKLALDLAQKWPDMTLANAQIAQLFSLGYDPKNPAAETSQKALQQYQRLYGDKTVDQKFSREWWQEHPEGTSDEFAKAFGEFKRGQYGRPMNAEQTFVQQWIAEHPNASADELSKAIGDFKARQKQGGLGATNLTGERQIAADVAQLVERYKQENPDATPDDVARYRAQQFRTLRAEAAGPTGNRIDDIKGKINRISYMEDTIGKVEELMKKHNMITGLGGKVTRPAEIVGNMFGSNETDRKQFERYIAELKEWAPRALTDSNGRPLAAEAGNVDKIIAGLRLGDTAANTARAYHELRQLLGKMKKDLDSRITGGGGGGKPAPKEEPQFDDRWWKSAPKVQ